VKRIETKIKSLENVLMGLVTLMNKIFLQTTPTGEKFDLVKSISLLEAQSGEILNLQRHAVKGTSFVNMVS